MTNKRSTRSLPRTMAKATTKTLTSRGGVLLLLLAAVFFLIAHASPSTAQTVPYTEETGAITSGTRGSSTKSASGLPRHLAKKSSPRRLQDAAEAGLFFVAPIGEDSSSSASSRVSSGMPNAGAMVRQDGSFPSTSSGSNSMSDLEAELVGALEQDDQVTVISPVQLGELLCDSLDGAEDAPALQLAISYDATVVAEQTSYTVVDASAFEDGIGRKVWAGVVVDPPQADDEAVPRTVSMTWGEQCDVQTFLLKVTTRKTDGSTFVIKSIPCDAGSSDDICLVEVSFEFKDSGEPVPVTPDPNGVSEISGGVPGDRFLREASVREVGTGLGAEATMSIGGVRRKTQSTTTEITVMVLYSQLGLELLGNVTPTQMETIVTESLVHSNAATVNSEIPLVFSLVYVGPLPYDEEQVSTYQAIGNLRANRDVGDLRDTYGADLVQMIGSFDDGLCGRGYYYTYGDPSVAHSVVGGNCIDNFVHTHEFGHNLGARHDRENTDSNLEYAHGLRYCDGTDPYVTIMSYPCDAVQANYFSNPDVMYLDKPTGTATENNARTIMEHMETVSNYRSVAETTPSPIEPITPPDTTPSPTTPSVAGGDLVDASARTVVRVSANAFHDTDECNATGCSAELTRDLADVSDKTSRWSCKYSMLNENCKLRFNFDDPMDIVQLEIAFYKGDTRTRAFLVKTFAADGTGVATSFTTSGTTAGFETFELNSSQTMKFYISPRDPDEQLWFSMKEVKIMVQ